VRTWQYVLIFGWKFCFVQTRPLCWKLLKSRAPSAKMTKRADVRLQMLFYTSSCTFLKIAKKWCTQFQNVKTCWSRAENAVLHKLVHFVGNHKKIGAPSAKMTIRADLGLKRLFCTNSCTSLKVAKKKCAQCQNEKTFWSWAENICFVQTRALSENAKKWCAQCENDKTCWSRAENAVLHELVHFAKNG